MDLCNLKGDISVGPALLSHLHGCVCHADLFLLFHIIYIHLFHLTSNTLLHISEEFPLPLLSPLVLVARQSTVSAQRQRWTIAWAAFVFRFKRFKWSEVNWIVSKECCSKVRANVSVHTCLSYATPHMSVGPLFKLPAGHRVYDLCAFWRLYSEQ